MTVATDPRYRTIARAAAAKLGTSSEAIVSAILAQWTCELGAGDAYPPARNNPGNLSRGAASGLGYPFRVTYPNPQPGNPIVTFDTATHGAQAYGTLIATGSRYAAARAAAKAGSGRAYILAIGASGYGTSTACMLAAYHPPVIPGGGTVQDWQIKTAVPGTFTSTTAAGAGWIDPETFATHPLPPGEHIYVMAQVHVGGQWQKPGYLCSDGTVHGRIVLAGDGTFVPTP